MTQVAVKMLGADRGIGGAVEDAREDAAADIEHARHQLRCMIAVSIGETLTLEQIKALSQPSAIDTLRFEIDRILTKVARWQRL